LEVFTFPNFLIIREQYQIHVGNTFKTFSNLQVFLAMFMTTYAFIALEKYLLTWQLINKSECIQVELATRGRLTEAQEVAFSIIEKTDTLSEDSLQCIGALYSAHKRFLYFFWILLCNAPWPAAKHLTTITSKNE
jgi:hypothetical protein